MFEIIYNQFKLTFPFAPTWAVDFFYNFLVETEYFFIVFPIVNRNYLLVLPILLVLWAIVFPKIIPSRKNLPKKSFKNYLPQLTRELCYTICTMSIIAIVLITVSNTLTGIGFYGSYPKITGIWSMLYAIFTLGLIFVWHDTYFFWTHKLLHHKLLFRHIHKTHHLSRDSTPLTSFSFSPLDAVIQAFAITPLFLVIPIPVFTVFLYAVLEAMHTFYGHSGYELFPKGFTRHWLGKHIATATHHNMHHEKVGGNYGLYFTWWDKWLGTEFEDYHTKFDELTK